MVLEQPMCWEIWYCCNRVLIPEQIYCLFNITRTLLPSVSKFDQFIHLCNGLIELIRVFGIGVRYNKSSFEDVFGFHIDQVGVDNRTTKSLLLGYSNPGKGVPVIVVNKMNLYCILELGSCIAEYLRLILLDL